MRRFLITAIVAAAVLGGVVLGMAYLLSITGRADYKGPPQLTYPENRPYRR
jgi:hypothetical protein